MSNKAQHLAIKNNAERFYGFTVIWPKKNILMSFLGRGGAQAQISHICSDTFWPQLDSQMDFYIS